MTGCRATVLFDVKLIRDLWLISFKLARRKVYVKWLGYISYFIYIFLPLPSLVSLCGHRMFLTLAITGFLLLLLPVSYCIHHIFLTFLNVTNTFLTVAIT